VVEPAPGDNHILFALDLKSKTMNNNQSSVVEPLNSVDSLRVREGTTVRVGRIRHQSLDEGPGYRTVLWFAGCSIRCIGCQTPELWSRASGQAVLLDVVRRALDRGQAIGDRGVTMIGGEPFDQPEALAELCEHVKSTWPSSTSAPRLMLYSGYTIETLQSRNDPAVARALTTADVLVDGPFIQTLFDANLAYRGSRNQRLIDLPRTFEAGNVITLDWDRPRITIHTDGIAVMSPAVANQIGLAANLGRHCGQYRDVRPIKR
jgi:anaerobic ribonucleoside-triphosphate reductase activating protein